MYRMGSKARGGLSLEFRQEFHGKYWNNECEMCSVFQQLAPQWSHCSNTFFQINWKLCWKKAALLPLFLLAAPSVLDKRMARWGKCTRLRRNRRFLGLSRVPTPLKLGKNYSWFIARLQHCQVWGKVDWAPWRQLGNDIVVNLCPFWPRPTPVILEGIVSQTVGELIHLRAGNYHG